MTTPDLTWPHANTTPDRHIWLRVLETTDVHAYLMPYDYHRDTDASGYGLARTATLIDRARAETGNSVLFDNGDFLQGSVLSDLATGPDSGWTGPHPVIAAMNQMGYDAACLGNHEFNFGLDWLKRALGQARFPILCANAFLSDAPASPGQSATLVPPTKLLDRTLHDSHGQPHRVRLGILGLLPPQITTWDHIHLDGHIATQGIVETALREVPRLRASGADIVIVLAHTGIGPDVPSPEDADPEQENAALALAKVPGIGAILMGHRHQLFPNPDAGSDIPGINHAEGTLAGVPAVMAGYRGSHLGVLDLCLVRDGPGWSVCTARSATRPVHPLHEAEPVPPDVTVLGVTRPAHEATLRLIARPIGHTAQPLQSYFAKICPCQTIAPVLAAESAALRAALAGTPHAGLPLLAATTCFRTGGHAGPDDFIDIPAGPLTLGNLAELYPFPNTLIGLRLTGAQIADWLERAASCFNQIRPGMGDTPQVLWNPAFAGHAFDTISELTYRIDLSQPPRYDANGRLLNPEARRIRGLRYGDAPLQAEAEFCLATNNFRAFGAGPYPKTSRNRVIHEDQKPVRDHLVTYVRNAGTIGTEVPGDGWTFDGPEDAVLLLETGPGVLGHPQAMAAFSARNLGTDAQGFVRLAIPLAVLTNLANPVETS